MMRLARPCLWVCQEGRQWVDIDICLWTSLRSAVFSSVPTAILILHSFKLWWYQKNHNFHSLSLPQPLLIYIHPWDSISGIGKQPDRLMEQSSLGDVINSLKQMKESESCQLYLWIQDCTFVSFFCSGYNYFRRSTEMPTRTRTQKWQSRKTEKAEHSFKKATCYPQCLPDLLQLWGQMTFRKNKQCLKESFEWLPSRTFF